MEIIEDLDSFENDGLMLSVGFFDGVHAGHRFLINQMCSLAKWKNLKTAILTFWPHPRLVLDEDYKPRLLNNLQEKQDLLSKLPLDYCINIPFTKELSDYFAGDFMHGSCDQHKPLQLFAVRCDMVGDFHQILIVLKITSAVLLYEIHGCPPVFLSCLYRGGGSASPPRTPPQLRLVPCPCLPYEGRSPVRGEGVNRHL